MKTVHGGNPWAALQGTERDPHRVLDFSADLNPFGPPASVFGHLREGFERIRWYPEPTYEGFRKAAAGYHDVRPDQILPGNGSSDLIDRICALHAGKPVALFAPTFTEYERAARSHGSPVVRVKGTFSFRAAKLLFLCNPNNPTGTLWRKERLLPFVEACKKKGIVLVVDEAVMDLVRDGLRYSAAGWTKRFSNLMVLRSLTKPFAVPGLRIGYLVGSTRLIEKLTDSIPPWSVNALAAFVGARLFKEGKFLQECRLRIKKASLDLREGLEALGCFSVSPSSANFLLCRMNGPRGQGRRLERYLLTHRILIRNCGDFPGLDEETLRISVRLPKENEQLLRHMRRFFRNAG